MRKDNMLTIIVPCYNEEEVLPETVKELGAVLESMISEEQVSSNSKLLFVDDGSKDKTWELIKKFENQFEYVTGIRFSRNYGHQNALLAGLTTAVDYSDMKIIAKGQKDWVSLAHGHGNDQVFICHFLNPAGVALGFVAISKNNFQTLVNL